MRMETSKPPLNPSGCARRHPQHLTISQSSHLLSFSPDTKSPLHPVPSACSVTQFPFRIPPSRGPSDVPPPLPRTIQWPCFLPLSRRSATECFMSPLARISVPSPCDPGAQAIPETTHVVFRQSPVAARKQDQAKERCRLHSIQDDRLARLKAQSPAFKIPGDALSPRLKSVPAVVKQREVIHIAQVPFHPQYFLAEMVQAVQIQIGEELADQVANWPAAPTFERGNGSSPG